MIVASLLLITVAVTLLVVGLAAGSSTLLIASIGTSLLAAVALVIGARQAAGRAVPAGSAPTPLAVDLDDDPGPATGLDETGRFAPVDSAGAYVPPRSGSTVAARSAAFDDTVVGHGPDPAASDPAASDPSAAGLSARGASVPGREDASARPEAPRAGATRPAAGRSGAVPDESADTEILDRVPDDGEESAADDPYADFHRQQAAAMHRDGAGARQVPDVDDPATRGAADGARDAEARDAGARDAGARDAGARDAGARDAGARDAGARDAGARDAGARDAGARDVGARDAVPGERDDAFDGVQAFGEQPSDDPDAVDEEDPADEPAPQRTQPADAVRVSRMVAEVLVVDGRPRYHLGDCPSLSGRITEPLAVAEAVELGFTPCSMCRPVDRLVAEAVPR